MAGLNTLFAWNKCNFGANSLPEQLQQARKTFRLIGTHAQEPVSFKTNLRNSISNPHFSTLPEKDLMTKLPTYLGRQGPLQTKSCRSQAYKYDWPVKHSRQFLPDWYVQESLSLVL